jgi:hypothetical protein
MILKVFYKNEIHRCSSFPQNLNDLKNEYLPKLFKLSLPQKFTLLQMINENEKIEITSEQEFQRLLNDKTIQTTKIEIKEQNDLSDSSQEEFEVIENISSKKNEENAHSSNELIKKAVSEHLFDKLLTSQKIDSDKEKLKELLSLALEEEMPQILAQVKEALDQDGFRENVNDLSKEKFRKEEEVDQRPKKEEIKEDEGNEKNDKGKNNNSGEKFKKIAQKIKAVIGFPKRIISKMSEKNNTDPMIRLPEGKFRKSCIDKAEKIREVFPDEDYRSLLRFVSKFSTNSSVEQIIEVYMDHMQRQSQ